jgi:hypothetical protein
MKIKVCDSPVYLHSIGKSVHIDLEHPLFARILERGDKAFCQGKGEHGVFIALNREMAEKARGVMEDAMEEGFHEAWQEIVGLSREIGWEKVQEMMRKAQAEEEVAREEGPQDEEPP